MRKTTLKTMGLFLLLGAAFCHASETARFVEQETDSIEKTAVIISEDHKDHQEINPVCFFQGLHEHPDVLKIPKDEVLEETLKKHSREAMLAHAKAIFVVYRQCLEAPFSVPDKPSGDLHK